MQKQKTGMVTGKEKASYGLYFLGQNIFYMLIYMYMNTYFTDVGISVAAVAVIALIVKVWDAVNDPLFGGLMDKIQFKKGKFLPWLRISLVGIPVATVLMFAIPNGAAPWVKVTWAVIAYMLWDTSYTLCDVPIFGIVTTITDVQSERTSMNAIGRVCAMIAVLIVMVIIPTFRSMLGGWTSTVLVLSIVGAITMVPICFTAKERCTPEAGQNQDVGIKDMMNYLVHNKYLLLYYVAFLIIGTANVGSVWGLYIARYCVGNEAIQSITGILGLLPSILLGMFVPLICRKVDKFKVYYFATAASAVLIAVTWIMGYQNLPVYLLGCVLACIPAGFTTVLGFMFTPDCCEYGQYKTGNSLPGITFAAQTFFAKLQSALVTAFGAMVLGLIGFVEGEGAVQAADFAQKMWNCSKLLPLAGTIIALVILHFYKLNDHDVQLMAKVNNGEMSREEAEAQMINKY